MPGPLSPEEQARINAYWGATAENSSPVAAPAPLPPGAFDPPAPPPGGGSPIPGAIAYDANAKIPGAITYDQGAKIPGAITYAPTPAPLTPETQAFKAGAQLSAEVPTMPRPQPGPTAEDNAAFERAKAGVASAPKPVARGPGNPDPYGSKAAMKGLLGTYDAQMDAVRRGHTAEADKALFVGEQTREISRRREEDATIGQLEAQAAAEHFDARMTEVERQLDDVRAKKIDPNRLMKESPGMGLLAVVGGVIGGVYQGLTSGQENGFLRDLNRMIDRDVAAQERDMDNDRQHFGEKLNLLSQQRAVWKDTQLAKLQTQNLYYEAAKENLAAEATRFDTPIYQARADEAIANIQRAQDELKLKIAQQLQAQSAAAASRQLAQQKEVRDVFRETYDKALAAGLAPAQAEFEASRVVGVLYDGGNAPARQGPTAGADPVSLVPKTQQEHALKEQDKYASAQRAKAALDDVWAKYEAGPDLPTFTGLDKLDTIKTGGLLQVRNALGEGFSSDKDTQNYVMTNLPRYGESAEARAQKLANVKAFIDSKASTPILDRHAPGWRESTSQEQAKQLGLKPVQ